MALFQKNSSHEWKYKLSKGQRIAVSHGNRIYIATVAKLYPDGRIKVRLSELTDEIITEDNIRMDVDVKDIEETVRKKEAIINACRNLTRRQVDSIYRYLFGSK